LPAITRYLIQMNFFICNKYFYNLIYYLNI
jgi:hypothetical protein